MYSTVNLYSPTLNLPKSIFKSQYQTSQFDAYESKFWIFIPPDTSIQNLSSLSTFKFPIKMFPN